MRLTGLSGQIKNTLTRTEVPLWARWIVFIAFVGLFLAWFSGVFGF